jgi:hypothetical protein
MLWKNYGEDKVLAVRRYHQIVTRTLLPYHLLKKDLIGYVNIGAYWIIYREGEELYKSFFAKNNLWFKTLTSELEFLVIRELPQIYLI